MRIWEMNPLTFGEELKAIREDANLTQKELAKKIYRGRESTVKNWEQEVCLPNMAALLEICKALKIDEIRIDTTKGWYYERHKEGGSNANS
jgi:transcriptional regulator with XRE-family HTH domain